MPQIPIKNIYYMLAYAFKVLREREYKKLEVEEFTNVGDLCTAILTRAVSIQIKRGLNKTYITETDTLRTLKGKIDISKTISQNTLMRKQLICSFDEISVNSYLNQIIKTTMMLLIKSDISQDRKKALKKVLVYFREVDTLDAHRINWNIRFNKSNKTYIMLINICYLVINGLVHSQKNGEIKLLDVFDEQRMSSLYEKFILEFYKKELSQDIYVSSSLIRWKVDDGFTDMLPMMKTDIMLKWNNKIYIIDAKYYSRTTQEQYGHKTLHSNNLYQIFAYVKNKETEGEYDDVTGMLLYAKTNEKIVPDNSYLMTGNRINVRSLDLNCEFEKIKEQLLEFVEEWKLY